MFLQYPLYAPWRPFRYQVVHGRFPQSISRPQFFWATADLIGEGDYAVGRCEGGGTQTGRAFSDFLLGSLPAATGRKMHFTGTTVLELKEGKLVAEIGLEDGVTAFEQLGLIKAA
jgi:SnoaL-like polyketide cyclase